MNTEDFVTYKQAITLKKLGFNENVNHYYNMGDNEIVENLIESVEDTNYIDFNHKGYEDEEIISAPTLSQVQKWLRGKGFYIETSLVYDTKKESYTCEIYKIPYKLITYFLAEYASYEEGLSAGITKCLKLLEKVE